MDRYNEMLKHRVLKGTNVVVTAGLLAGSLLAGRALGQGPAAAGQNRPGTVASHYQPNRVTRRAGLYYGLVWGVDSLTVKTTESSEIVRFSYRVLDADKAQPLNDQKAEPSLIDPRAGVRLVVPSLEQVGLLRQSSPAQAGKVYWMAFSNKGRRVKRGDRVIVTIGKFHADGLVVE